MTLNSPRVQSDPALTAEQIARAARYLAETRDKLTESVAPLSISQWNFKPAPDRWSIAEIVEHVVVLEDRVHGVVTTIGDAPKVENEEEQLQRDEVIVRMIPDRSTRVLAPLLVYPAARWSGPEALEKFVESRARTIQLLSASPLRGHVASHPLFGAWDGYQWLLATAAHSARHTGQIEEVKECPGFN